MYYRQHTVVCILVRSASFPRFWIVQKKWYLIWKGCLFSLRRSKFLWKKKSKWPRQKTSFSSSTNSQYFFIKFLWLGPWVSRINWCEGHWCGSTYMVVRIGGAGKRRFFESPILNFLSWPFWIFFTSSLWKKQPVHILGIIYFCTMDGFSRILEKKLSELLCTQL
jgi:hypothetical protein